MNVTGAVFLLLLAVHITVSSIYKNQIREEEYDYIIVGAGSSGSVLANRLSECVSNKVLLLEAGGAPTGISEIPLFSLSVIGGQMDWKYVTEPQENACLQMEGQRSHHPRGKVLGGTSTINGLMYVRGDRRDFDQWAEDGATGWSWDQVLHYFKKSEDQRDPQLAATGLHGVKGYQTVSVPEFGTPLRDAYYEAMRSSGYNLVDINSGNSLGYSKVQSSTRDGFRCSTEKAFLRPAASRENLDILLNAHVTKILFDDEKRADSVQFEWKNSSRVIRAKKEIILSAGVYGSAQLLMLSGVGPKEHLQELDIPVISDLPVGQNLQDHVTGGQVYFLNSSVGLVNSRVTSSQSIGDLLEGKGPLTIPAGVECLAAINTKYQEPDENWPDIRLFLSSFVMFAPHSEQGKSFIAETRKKHSINVHAMLARPKSIGYFRLRSTNPHDHPIINPQYLSEEDDLKRLAEGMKMADKLVHSAPLEKFGPVRYPEVVAGCEGLDVNEDKYYECVARGLTLSSFHHCCTCKMGNPQDSTTVVDPQLRVKGVKGLRVADASIMPTVTSGNTNAPCIMIGEKAADMVQGKV